MVSPINSICDFQRDQREIFLTRRSKETELSRDLHVFITNASSGKSIDAISH